MAFITLYKSLVRPLLEYGSIVWSPFQKNNVNQFENIQSRFIPMLGPRLWFTYHTNQVDDVEKSFALLPLILRRHHNDIILLYKLINGLSDCPNFLSGIDIPRPEALAPRLSSADAFSQTNILTTAEFAVSSRLVGRRLLNWTFSVRSPSRSRRRSPCSLEKPHQVWITFTSIEVYL
ncbi:hypothetical protein J6590_077300 [Homalodisca vitripennis]|nr:hypothetical protein J6590_077300 [Homalodisca vitripennis]